jgi:beta-lactamase class A
VALLNAVIAAHPGYGISMIKIDGPSVNVNGTKQFESASTYKLYVAYSVLKAIENGQMSWSDNVAGRTAEKCLEDMIVVSDNDCPVAFKTKLGGWSVIENQAHAIGISSRTSLTGPTLLTTANDLSFFLYRLQKGALLNSSDTDRLLGLMKRQKYRDGIPAGTGLPVADKVGFVDDVIHDAGIVYSPKGTYVLVIMTTSTWSGIASAAKTINAGL